VVRKNFGCSKISVDVGESGEAIAAETAVGAVIAYLLAA
jgi:hypothetical protein